MTILIAPDSFKGTYTAAQVADAILDGIESVGARGVTLPVADGGEGTLAALCGPLRLDPVAAPARNPWGLPLTGRYGLSSTGTALIELAEASGITTPHPGRRDPVSADTYGTGMLIADAVCRGATRVILAAGGSATTDGGAGAVAALRGVDLSRVEIAVLTDVTTRFTDAAVVFGPQKGADAATVVALTERLRHQGATYPRDPDTVAGGGAAGGFAGGMWAHFDARLVPGADFVLDACGFDAALAGATAVVVGEGRLDAQTTQGKIIAAILRRAGDLPVYAVVGSVTDCDRAAFADILVASDRDAMTAAGRVIGEVSSESVRR